MKPCVPASSRARSAGLQRFTASPTPVGGVVPACTTTLSMKVVSSPMAVPITEIVRRTLHPTGLMLKALIVLCNQEASEGVKESTTAPSTDVVTRCVPHG